MPIIAFYALAAAVIFAAGWGFGSSVTGNSYKAKLFDAKQESEKLRDEDSLRLNTISSVLEATLNEKRIVYRTIEKRIPQIVERPVYRNVCLDDDGLRLINDALAGSIHPAEPANAVSVTGSNGR